MGSMSGAAGPVPGGADGRPPADVMADFETRGVERLSLFSDAVIAIAITLLAIELPLPTGDTASTLWTSVRHEDGHYFAFLISFAVIAASWADHHDLFRCLARVDPRLRTLNCVWLLMIVLNPFATRLLTVRGHPTIEAHALRFGFYALLQVLDSALMLAMLLHMRSRRQAPDTPQAIRIKIAYGASLSLVSFGASIPVFFATPYAWVLWIVLPLAMRQLHRLHPHLRRRFTRAGRVHP
jgi:uncharacterized membrane protein